MGLLSGIAGFFGGNEQAKNTENAMNASKGYLLQGFNAQKPFMEQEISKNQALFDDLMGKFNGIYAQNMHPWEMANAMLPFYKDAVLNYSNNFSQADIPKSMSDIQTYQLDQAGKGADRTLSAMGLNGSGAGMRARDAAINPLRLSFNKQNYDHVMGQRQNNINNLSTFFQKLTGNPLNLGAMGGTQVGASMSGVSDALRNRGAVENNLYNLLAGVQGEGMRNIDHYEANASKSLWGGLEEGARGALKMYMGMK